MRFSLAAEQRQFGAALHELLTDADVPAAARAWAAGERGPGLAIWGKLAGLGVTGLAVPAEHGGLGADPVDLVVACEELGHHPVPGPLAESVAAVPVLLAGLAQLGVEQAGGWLAGLAAGELIATVAVPPRLPYALDAEVAGLVLLASAEAGVSRARVAARLRSADPARVLCEVSPDEELAPGAAPALAVAQALASGTLASAALLLGAGRALLELTVQHARTREQFGRPVGSFQAVKHALADVAIGVEFARPLVYAAAVAVRAGAPTASRDVSAARVASAAAAKLAARTALQVHGAIGYTLECDVSLWLAKVRALAATWGSQAEHRALVAEALAQERTGPWS